MQSMERGLDIGLAFDQMPSMRLFGGPAFDNASCPVAQW